MSVFFALIVDFAPCCRQLLHLSVTLSPLPRDKNPVPSKEAFSSYNKGILVNQMSAKNGPCM